MSRVNTFMHMFPLYVTSHHFHAHVSFVCHELSWVDILIPTENIYCTVYIGHIDLSETIVNIPSLLVKLWNINTSYIRYVSCEKLGNSRCRSNFCYQSTITIAFPNMLCKNIHCTAGVKRQETRKEVNIYTNKICRQWMQVCITLTDWFIFKNRTNTTLFCRNKNTVLVWFIFNLYLQR